MNNTEKYREMRNPSVFASFLKISAESKIIISVITVCVIQEAKASSVPEMHPVKRVITMLKY